MENAKKTPARNRFIIVGILLLISVLLGVCSYWYINANHQGTLILPPTMYIITDWVIPAVVGILLLLKLPHKVFGVGFMALAVCQLLCSPAVITPMLLSSVFYILLAETLLLKKLPAKKLSIVYAFLAVLSFLIRFTSGGWRIAIINFAQPGVIIRFVFQLAAQVLALSAATRGTMERPHPLGMVGIGIMAFGALLRFIINAVSLIFYNCIVVFDGYDFTVVLWNISFLLVIIGACLLPFACKCYTPRAAAKSSDGNGYSTENADGYISIGIHILLLLFTFGIWGYIWIYKTTIYLNSAPNVEQENPTSKLLLCIFVPFYYIYWLYKHGQRIDALTKERGLNHSDMATMCLILGIFIPIIAYILMQDRINSICTAPARATSTKNTDSVVLENIQKLKDLLDSGAITQEEFDAKKKEFLDL